MKVLLDNNLPRGVSAALAGHQCLIVRDVLGADATDSEIFAWCNSHDVDILVTKDRQFSWVIASGNSRLKCVLCVFGNMSMRETVAMFEENKTRIEYFAKSNSRILEI